MAITTSAITSELYANVVQTALYQISEQTVIRPLVKNFDLSGTPGLTAQIPIYPAISASDLTEGTDLVVGTNDVAFNTTSVEVTCAEKGVLVSLTDLARDASTGDVGAAIGRQIGDAMAKKIDTDLAALFSGFSNTVGSGNTELTVEDIFKASAILRSGDGTEIVPGPYVGLLHPKQAFQIKKQLTGAGNTNMTNPSNVGNSALVSGAIGRVAGIDLYETSVITGDSAGAFAGCVMSSEALAYVLKRPMAVAVQRDESRRLTEFVGTSAYAVKELRDTYGVQLLGDANL
ncbi:MAG: putative major capsid protein [Prokaryotic dsDNA virus sp.]|jgi:N4-gp56 family major capsid protein|nr:MAG: putative major capsid protein [Prokaryotic dsDNA virus sp.]|tara:strand:- start:9635 stop:10501 length:867 start_codon:yes stop_codon:yes gene_type:complete